MKSRILLLAIVVIIALLINGCSNSTEPTTSGSLSLSTKYSMTALAKISNLLAADSIKITKATYILREIKFKTQKDSSDGLFKSTPLVLEFNLAGNVQNVGLLDVPFGTYTRLEFDIHKAEASDTTAMSADQKIKIRPFFVGGKYSVIIEGKIYEGTSQRTFVYKSTINAKQKIDLAQPLVISDIDPTANATMLISSNGWFRENNNLLDPTDTKSESKIDDNIRRSIKIIKDKKEME